MALRPRWEVESKEEQPSRPRWELGTESPIIEMEDGGWKKKESPSVKLALAMALVRSNRHLNLNQPLNVLSPSATSDQIRHWKKKAKDRKSEIVRLREEIKLLQDGSGCELEPPIASCRCHFFEGCGDVGPLVTDGSTGDEHWINNVLRRRFIRLGISSVQCFLLRPKFMPAKTPVRWKERRRRVERPIERRSFVGKHYKG